MCDKTIRLREEQAIEIGVDVMEKDYNSLLPTPGDRLREKIKEFGWTQSDLATVLGRPLQTINLIVQNKKSITPDMAVALGTAFDTGPGLWMELESNYRLSLVKAQTTDIETRARIYNYAPIKEMQRRQWIKQTDDAEEQERELCRFFEIDSLDAEPTVHVAARESIRSGNLTMPQKAWCFRARQLARSLSAGPMNRDSLSKTLSRLRELAAFPEEARHVSKVLGESGIKFLVIEPLSGCRIDGAAIWVDTQSPVIVVSLRYDRIDTFWFTLMHEFMHIVHGDASVDDNLVGDGQMPSIAKENIERRADEEAAKALIPSDKIDSFILRVGPLYSKQRIIQFAHRIKIHPGIIVGQLQYRGEIGYSSNREMLAKVRDIVISSTITDGWGHAISKL